MPENYEAQGARVVFCAREDEDFNRIEQRIQSQHYYDSFGVWSNEINYDNHVTAAMAIGLGAGRCLDFGCFNGSVLSVLADAGCDVTGVDLSHLALAISHPNVRDRLFYGDLLSLDLKEPFDVIIAMDIFEHLNPLRVLSYASRVGSLLARDGYVIFNSPMFGRDDIFGAPFEPYLEEWSRSGDTSFWRHLHCDDAGWPLHGHLVWASPRWWEAQFLMVGLERDRAMEVAIQHSLPNYFHRFPARRTMFVLRHSGAIHERSRAIDIVDTLGRLDAHGPTVR